MSALRVAFVGRGRELFGHLPPAVPGVLEPVVLDTAGTSDRGVARQLDAAQPDAVVALFGLQLPPAAVLAGRDVPCLAWSTEPLPRDHPAAPPAAELATRTTVAQLDPSAYDCLVVGDAQGAAVLEQLGLAVHRAAPPPVADGLFDTARRQPSRPPRVGFVGASTEFREVWLTDAKHRFDLLHVAHGLEGERLAEVFGSLDVAVSVRGEAFHASDPMLLIHLAAGHLVVCDPLGPTFGLEPGLDLLEAGDPVELGDILAAVREAPEVWTRLRVRGRQKAERLRASRVWPRAVGDLVRDCAGRPRCSS
ncbi:hypothetical protein [Conexibacter sp. SYSU D00693]|uniref:hypothetical protein n=1 Tax=Conexibacter sp. SYSU D00693 TaxID=2812560 RepID=UPI00196B0983|nr:hypothetical protein [Conexibacter sp. SYSU D00693]